MASCSEVKLLIGKLAAVYPHAKIDGAMADAYASFLADAPIDAVLRAVERHVTTSRFFPMIADIRALIAEEQTGDVPQPEEAWLEVKEAIRKVGSYGVPQFSHPTISSAVAAVGWETLCAMQIEEAGIYQAQFVKMHAVFRKRLIGQHVALPSASVPLALSGLMGGGRPGVPTTGLPTTASAIG